MRTAFVVSFAAAVTCLTVALLALDTRWGRPFLAGFLISLLVYCWACGQIRP